MRKRLGMVLAICLWVFCMGIAAGAGRWAWNQKEMDCVITEPKMGDSKIVKDKIVSVTDGHMIIFNFDGTVFREYPQVHVNWIYAFEEENLIAAGNGSNELRLITFRDSWEVRSDCLIQIPKRRDCTLRIDPTIIKAADRYILSYIEIAGTVNNADPEAENGVYTAKCMQSDDLENWTYLSDIVSDHQNIEDADMLYIDGCLYYFFEKEDYDKGPSSIRVIVSRDGGLTWGRERQLVLADADNELAAVEADEQGYVLFYSSDRKNPGSSYNGAGIYRSVFTKDFEWKETAAVDVHEDRGILLYDVRRTDVGMYFLYVQNYITENNLVWKKMQGIYN